MATTKKIETVKEIGEKIQRSSCVVLTNYQKLTHKQLEDLRKLLKKHEAEFLIAKNTLFLKAMKDFLGKEPELVLEGQTAILFAYGDEIAPIKELLKFAKTNAMPQLKAGFLKTTKLSVDDLNRLVKLPNKQTLIAQLVGQLNAPIQGLHRSLSWNIQKFVYALSAIQKTK